MCCSHQKRKRLATKAAGRFRFQRPLRSSGGGHVTGWPMFNMKFNGTLAAVTLPIDRLADGAAMKAGCWALNHTVAKAKTQVGRAVAAQSGLGYGNVTKEIRQFSASPARPEAELKASGGYHRLSEFDARQGGKGVSAAPWGTRRIFPHTFFIAKFGGGVFRRQGSSRFPVKQLWGPAIPKEMVKDRSLRVWETTLSAELPARMAHEWGRIMGGG